MRTRGKCKRERTKVKGNKFSKCSILAPVLLSASLFLPVAAKAENKNLIPKDLKGQVVVFESKPKAGPTKIIIFGEDNLIKVQTINSKYTNCDVETWEGDEKPEKTKKLVEEVENGLEEKIVGKMRGEKLTEKKAAKMEDIPEEYSKYIAEHVTRLCKEEETKTETVEKAVKSGNSEKILKAENSIDKLEIMLWSIAAAMVLAVFATMRFFRRKPKLKQKEKIKKDIKGEDEDFMNWTSEMDE